MSYDSWKSTEPDREPSPGEHRPGDDTCDCDECQRERHAVRVLDRADGWRAVRDLAPVASDPGATIAPWFARVLDSCEALSLDSARDRVMLWERVSEAWPRDAIRAMVADNVEAEVASDHERQVERVTAAVIAALEES